MQHRYPERLALPCWLAARHRSARRAPLRRFSARASAWLALVVVGAAPLTASAYCRTHTCEFDGRQVCDVDTETGCSQSGEIAHWDSNCMSFAVQVEGSEDEGISADTLRQLVAAGFRSWSEVECEGAPGLSPALSASFRGETACDQVEYNCGVQNENIVMFRDGGSSLSSNTIALSTIIANLRTGEILDVDIEINSQDFDFYVSPERPRPGEQDLRLVMNHELGHMLGLSHSTDAEALMRAEYGGSNPLPALDDTRAMCSVFEPAESDPACLVTAIEGAGACVGTNGTCPGVVASKRSGCGLSGELATGRSDIGMGVGLGLFAALRRRHRPFARQARREQAKLRRFHG